MKATGIIRKVDSLGRVVLPKEMRKVMNIIEDETALEIFVDGSDIILRRYTPGCHYCGEMDNLTTVLGLDICPKCLAEFKKASELINKIRR